MKTWLALLFALASALVSHRPAVAAEMGAKKVFIIPVRQEVQSPLLYLVRRGVKEAIDANADLIVLDMETDGGSVGVTMDIIDSVDQFKGQTVTYVNKRAFSAGAFICFGTQKIYMAPQSVIGAAAVVMGTPGGGTQPLPDTLEVKTASAISALVRANAEKHGHNVEVADAMVKKTKELKIDDKVLNEKGQILTLTAKEAEENYGNPPKPLLSSGTVKGIDDLLQKLGYAGAERVDIKPTGMERIGSWLNAISPLLLIIGVIGIYIEFKTPGFGLPGIVGIAAFALYFLGGYAAGLSGLEWIIVFVAGLALIVVELFVLPGHLVFGLLGSLLVLAAVVMAMVDVYPQPGPGLPTLPSLDKFQLPLRHILIAMLGGAAGIWAVSRILPKTPIYRAVVSTSASGMKTEAAQAEQRKVRHGQIGVAISILRPGGKAQFGDEILDVISQGEIVPKGTRVRIAGSSGNEAVVEVVKEG